jgi:hypothetical protein
LHGAQISRGKGGKISVFSSSGYTRACLRNFLFPVPNYHTEFLAFLRSSPPLFSRFLPPLGCFFARDCAHAGGPVRLSDGHRVSRGVVRRVRHRRRRRNAATTTHNLTA